MTKTTFMDEFNEPNENEGVTDPNYDPIANFKEEMQDEYIRVGRFNLWIVGNSGTGKSTLINAMFGQLVANTGSGKPVTPNTNYLEHPSGTFGVFDSRGFEPGMDMNTLLVGLENDIVSRRRKPLNEQIHVAWFVVDRPSDRFLPQQAQLLQKIQSMGVPVVLVMTKTKLDHNGELDLATLEFMSDIENAVGTDIAESRVFPVLAEQMVGTAAFGLEALLDCTRNVAPTAVLEALDASQQLDWELKRSQGQRIIAFHAAAAAVTAAVPVSVPQAALLLPTTLNMIVRLSRLHGIPTDSNILIPMITEMMVQGGIKFVAQQLLSLVKPIPGMSLINAAVAASLVSATGYAWLRTFEFLGKTDPETRQKYLTNVAMFSELLTAFVPKFNEANRKAS
jgi:predicted GTPase